MELNFKIIVVPETKYSPEDEEDLRFTVENYVERCDLRIVSINYFKMAKEEEAVSSEIKELILSIRAKTGNSYPTLNYMQYETFCYKWDKESNSMPCHYIGLYTADAFLKSRYARTDISCPDLHFGVLPHDCYFHEYASLHGRCSVTFYHDTRFVVVLHGQFEIRFSYDNIRNVIVNIMKYPVELFLDLFNPPLIFRVEYGGELYRRRNVIKHRNLNMKGSPSEIDADILGRANVLCFQFISSRMELEKIISNIHFRCSEKAVLYSRISHLPKYKPPDLPLHNMEFSCMYMMTALFKRNFVLLAQYYLLLNDLIAKLTEFSQKNEKALENALIDVLSALDSGKFLNYWVAIESRYWYYVNQRNMDDFKEYIVPTKCSMSRRITVTPTRLLLWAPELLFGNRIIRTFESEFAVRVSFRDDNIQRLTFVAMHADGEFLDVSIKNPCTKGLRIGPRHYQFLAWSNSQIRDHSIWMYAKDKKGRTSITIRKWMGEFSHIHNVPKYMSRMGQCFSQTEDTVFVPLHPKSVRTISDIEGGYDPENRKPYCFSDGVGRISTELAEEVHDALGHDKLCSAFQIRFGGYKGMLVVDPTLKDTKIVFRKSMKKFECPNSTRLEIARTSAPVALHLNRPFIAILNDLGVRHRVFLRLQENMLKEITDMLFDEKKAAKSLKLQTQALYGYQELSSSGIHLTTEPFFRSILLSLHRRQINVLKSKSNVAIDPQYGRNMLGVLDETGILNYGEVFVQYSTDISYGETTRETTIIEGEVLVTKNPCHFPGDVRKFQAIDVPTLHHIVDCIVFPQTGMRPHPSEMSGSDQDGDEFAVLWLPELKFQCPNKPAAHFPAMKSPDVENITVADMIECLISYIREDQIGSISHAHLALADKYGVEASICKAVARKCSIAVDFAKTGKVEPLTREEKPQQFPDFMEKEYKEQYKSLKALGKMYRICRDYETENEETSNMYQPIELDRDLVYPGWERYGEDALRMRNKYNSFLGSLLRNYGIEDEAEVISGAFTRLHSRFQERNDRMDIQKVISACFKNLISTTAVEFIEEFLHWEDLDTIDEAVSQKASAWYVVTYSGHNCKYLSFPWTVSKYLANIKVRKSLGKTPPFSPAIMQLDAKIIECENENLLPDYRKEYKNVFRDTNIWKNYLILCDPLIVKRALRALVLWAQDEEILEAPGRPHEGLLFISTFIKLFLHVATLQKYMTLADLTPDTNKSYSSALLCVEFLKFCSSLRFYNETDIKEVLPFPVFKYNKLAKRAVISYHRFALSGIFRNLYFDRKIKDDLIDMKPFPIDSKIFSQTVIIESSLRKAEKVLMKYSKVDDLHLAEHRQTKKVWVSALGSERAIKELKWILRKKHEFLKQLFQTGVMPQDESLQGIVRNLKRPCPETAYKEYRKKCNY